MFNVFKTVNLSKIERAVQAMHATNGPKTVWRKHAYNHDVWLALEIGLNSLNTKYSVVSGDRGYFLAVVLSSRSVFKLCCKVSLEATENRFKCNHELTKLYTKMSSQTRFISSTFQSFSYGGLHVIA